MNSHTKFARLSQQAMTSQHGLLLQDSGFTKLDSTPTRSEDWARTTMPRQEGLSYLSSPTGTVTGRWSSGRPAIQSIPRTAGLSTSALQFREIASMYTTQELVAAMHSAIEKLKNYTVPKPRPYFLPKTYFQRLSAQCLEQGMAMPSWVQPLGSIQLRCFSDLEDRYYSGLTPTQQAKMLGSVYADSFDLSAYSHHP